MIVSEDIMCQFTWFSSLESDLDGDDPHDCKLLDGHTGPHRCSYVNCNATHENQPNRSVQEVAR